MGLELFTRSSLQLAARRTLKYPAGQLQLFLAHRLHRAGGDR